MGFGVITEMSTGYPGYDSVIEKNSATIGTILKQNGYATSWFGKNHNTPSYQLSLAGPYDQWPSGMGFDYFYGFMGGETDQGDRRDRGRCTEVLTHSALADKTVAADLVSPQLPDLERPTLTVPSSLGSAR